MQGDRGVGLRTKLEQRQNNDGGEKEGAGMELLHFLRRFDGAGRTGVDSQEARRRVEGEERVRNDGMRQVRAAKRAGKAGKGADMRRNGDRKRGVRRVGGALQVDGVGGARGQERAGDGSEGTVRSGIGLGGGIDDVEECEGRKAGHGKRCKSFGLRRGWVAVKKKE